MFNLNDDMDPIFRKAGENYPLKTDSADWNKINDALQKNVSHDHYSNNRKNDSYNKLLIMMLLVLVPFLSDTFIEFKNGKYLSDKKFENSKSNVPENRKEPAKTKFQNPALANTLARQNTSRFRPVTQDIVNEPSDKQTAEFIHTPMSFSNAETDLKKTEVNSTLDELGLEQQKIDHQTILNTNEQQSEAPLTGKDMSGNQLLKSKIAPASPVEPAQKISAKQDRSSIYFGILGGMDVTTVKYQQVNNAGFNYGILLGYKIGDHLNIEGGLLSTTKYYSTNGAHFNTSKLALSSTTRVLAVEGDCRMIEIPVVLKYDFTSATNNKWFVAAGISNLLMKQENYNYVYLYTVSGREAKYFRTYKNSSKNWLSILQFSGGYSYKMKNIVDLRVEPYIQVPLKGVGFGELPLTSGGLRIGVTRSLF
ncbi:MAG TPA: porin family protein [Flavisolibacter sp.]|nr:porin family protein [Flavisolibacter sp.]